MPPRLTPADQLADAVRASLDGEPTDLRAALDDYSRRTGYAVRLGHRIRRRGGRQSILGWSITEKAEAAGIDRDAAAQIVRTLVASGRVVRVARGRYLDCTHLSEQPTNNRRKTLRVGSLIECMESA